MNNIGLNTLTAEGIRDTTRIGWDTYQWQNTNIQDPHLSDVTTGVSLVGNTLSALDTGYKALGNADPAFGNTALMAAATANPGNAIAEYNKTKKIVMRLCLV